MMIVPMAAVKWWNPMYRWPLDCMSIEKISLGISCSVNIIQKVEIEEKIKND